MLIAEERERRLLLDKCDRLAWRLGVEAKFVNAMAAATAGEPIDWQVWPPTDPQATVDQAATEYVCGYAEVLLDREPEAYSIGSPPPSTTEILDRIARHRAEHGPYLRELRCDSTVLTYLTLRIPPSKAKPWEPQPLGTPIIQDEDVPARHLRRVYDDGTTEDVEVMSEAVEYLVRTMPDALELKPPYAPDSFAEYYRWGTYATPFQPPPFSIGSYITGV